MENTQDFGNQTDPSLHLKCYAKRTDHLNLSILEKTGQPALKVIFKIAFYSLKNYVLLDITCIEEPPDIPTNVEYTLASDDGNVLINSLVYPSHQRTFNYKVNSTMNSTLLPRNYMANLT